MTRRARRSAGAGLIVAGLIVALAGCGGGNVEASGAAVPQSPLDPVSGTLTVRAEPSFSDVFNEVAATVESDHPKLTVRVTYTDTPAASTGGADLIASTSRQSLDRLQREGAVSEATVVAQQPLALVVAPGDPGHVGQLADLGRPGVSTALCDASTSCGDATTALLQRGSVQPGQVQHVSDSTAALRAVTGSKVDAALIWTSEIRGASGKSAFQRGVREVVLAPLPQRNIRLLGFGSRQVLTAVATHGNQPAANAFVDEIRSGSGQQLLRDDGFR